MECFICIFLMVASSHITVSAAEILTPYRIVNTAETNYLRGSTQALVDMVVKRDQNERKIRYRLWLSEHQKALLEIVGPRKDEGHLELRINRELWSYSPKNDRIQKLSSLNYRQIWMDSDLTYDDVTRFSSLTRDYKHKFVRSEKINGEENYLIECFPKETSKFAWGRILYWIKRDNLTPTRQYFYNNERKWVRAIEFESFKKTKWGWTPTRLTIRNPIDSGTMTVLSFKKVTFDKKMDESIFSLANLQRSSQKKKYSAGFGAFSFY